LKTWQDQNKPIQVRKEIFLHSKTKCTQPDVFAIKSKMNRFNSDYAKTLKNSKV
jgi:hypothetical protein